MKELTFQMGSRISRKTSWKIKKSKVQIEMILAGVPPQSSRKFLSRLSQRFFLIRAFDFLIFHCCLFDILDILDFQPNFLAREVSSSIRLDWGLGILDFSCS